MWDTAFKESMLSEHENIIINCPNKFHAEQLMMILEQNGINWATTGKATSNTHWSENEEETCYFVESKDLSYSDKEYADSGMDGGYPDYFRCTFYGIEYPDFETATDTEIAQLFAI